MIKVEGVGRDDDDPGAPVVVRYVRKGRPATVRARLEVLLCAGESNGEATGAAGDYSSFRGVDNPLPALLADFNSFNFFFKSDDSLEHPDMEFLGGISPTGPNTGMLGVRMYQNVGACGPDGGTMRLRSDDPFEDMDVTRNFFATEESVRPMLLSVKKVIALVRNVTESLGVMLIEPSTFVVDVDDDEALNNYVRQNMISEMHLMSSMRMGTAKNGAVVDGDLRIIGSNGRIRVADTSVFPNEMRGHPMATAMAVGMKAASMVAETTRGRLLLRATVSLWELLLMVPLCYPTVVLLGRFCFGRVVTSKIFTCECC